VLRIFFEVKLKKILLALMFLFLKNSKNPENDLKKYVAGINDAVVKSTVEY